MFISSQANIPAVENKIDEALVSCVLSKEHMETTVLLAIRSQECKSDIDCIQRSNTLFFPEKAAECNAEFLNHGLGNRESVQKIAASFASDLHVHR